MKLAPEIDVLLAFVRARHSREPDELERSVSRVLDWPTVVELARQQAVTPLVLYALDQLPNRLVPAKAQDCLRTRTEWNRIRNLEQSAELLRLLERLEGAGI